MLGASRDAAYPDGASRELVAHGNRTRVAPAGARSKESP